jgi:hypothetical protein
MVGGYALALFYSVKYNTIVIYQSLISTISYEVKNPRRNFKKTISRRVVTFKRKFPGERFVFDGSRAIGLPGRTAISRFYTFRKKSISETNVQYPIPIVVTYGKQEYGAILSINSLPKADKKAISFPTRIQSGSGDSHTGNSRQQQ